MTGEIVGRKNCYWGNLQTLTIAGYTFIVVSCGIMVDASHTVLIVEDQQFLSSILKSRLERDGVQVAQAFDGDAALQYLESTKPGVIVLDLIMPKVSGFEVLQAIAMNQQLNTIPVLVLSNLAQDEDVNKAKQYGVKEYFVKVRNPVEALVQRIKAYLPPPTP